MICPVEFDSPEYWATVELRRDVLRLPLGLDFTDEQLQAEGGDVHLALIEEGKAVACLILVRVNDETLKMRQVAVSDGRQGQGLGKALVAASEAWAKENGFFRIELHARETAVPFYLSQGYVLEGEPFEEVGIPHREMFKLL